MGFWNLCDLRNPLGGWIGNELAFSRDAVNWQRLNQVPDIRDESLNPIPRDYLFLPFTPPGGWANRMIHPQWGGILTSGDRHWIYADGRTYKKSPKFGEKGVRSGQIGLLTLRRDGFVSLASEVHTGTVTTRPLRLIDDLSAADGIPAGRRQLHLNLVSPNGYFSVEILDSAGDPVVGLEPTVVRQDSTDWTVPWSDEVTAGSRFGAPFRLRFRLCNARLYSLWFS